MSLRLLKIYYFCAQISPMLTNKQIAAKIDLLAKVMELHDENPFKIKTYANAYLSLRKLEGSLADMPIQEIATIKGIGSSTAEKIMELIQTGHMKALQHYQDITPAGVLEMLTIKGFGPKKVKQIWKEMEIETAGELLYACNENRLIHYSGFGTKVQADIKEKLEYFQASQGKYLYAHVHQAAEGFLHLLKNKYPNQQIELSGDIRRKMPEVKGIEILTDVSISISTLQDESLDLENNTYKSFPYFIETIPSASFISTWFSRSCSEDFLVAFEDVDLAAQDEATIFAAKGYPYIPAECRELKALIPAFNNPEFRLVSMEDIKGIVHNHSTYSDGLHTLQQMADYVHTHGYQYFVISDHSKSAGYAGGLKEDRLYEQWREIDHINAKYNDGFKVFKSIESDILIDGSLDYANEILQQFDLVIASIHSVLNMDIDKATSRLIKAIENPYTTILGHPTGRLLLARPGYAVDYLKVIDACAANGVAIELNANPQRLDLDWTWIPYAMEKDIMIAINPDAHSMVSIHYVKYGVDAARKGGLTTTNCLNALGVDAFSRWISQKK